MWTVAVQEPGGGFTDPGITTEAVATDDGFTLSGTKRHVLFASAAQHPIAAAKDTDDRVDLFVVDAGAEGMTLTQQMSDIEGRYWIMDKSLGSVLIILYKLFHAAAMPEPLFLKRPVPFSGGCPILCHSLLKNKIAFSLRTGLLFFKMSDETGKDNTGIDWTATG